MKYGLIWFLSLIMTLAGCATNYRSADALDTYRFVVEAGGTEVGALSADALAGISSKNGAPLSVRFRDERENKRIVALDRAANPVLFLHELLVHIEIRDGAGALLSAETLSTARRYGEGADVADIQAQNLREMREDLVQDVILSLKAAIEAAQQAVSDAELIDNAVQTTPADNTDNTNNAAK